eukprot:tig00000404_g410.t1
MSDHAETSGTPHAGTASSAEAANRRETRVSNRSRKPAPAPLISIRAPAASGDESATATDVDTDAASEYCSALSGGETDASQSVSSRTSRSRQRASPSDSSIVKELAELKDALILQAQELARLRAAPASAARNDRGSTVPRAVGAPGTQLAARLASGEFIDLYSQVFRPAFSPNSTEIAKSAPLDPNLSAILSAAGFQPASSASNRVLNPIDFAASLHMLAIAAGRPENAPISSSGQPDFEEQLRRVLEINRHGWEIFSLARRAPWEAVHEYSVRIRTDIAARSDRSRAHDLGDGDPMMLQSCIPGGARISSEPLPFRASGPAAGSAAQHASSSSPRPEAASSRPSAGAAVRLDPRYRQAEESADGGVCWLFNNGRCDRDDCSRRHVCIACGHAGCRDGEGHPCRAGRPRGTGGRTRGPQAATLGASISSQAPSRPSLAAPLAPSCVLVSRVDPALPEAPLPPPCALAPPALRAPRRAPPAPSLALVSRVHPALLEAPLPPPRALAPPALRAPRRAPPAPSLALVSRVDPALPEAPLPPPAPSPRRPSGPRGGRRRRRLSRWFRGSTPPFRRRRCRPPRPRPAGPPGPAAGAAGAVSRAGFAGRPRPSGGAAAASPRPRPAGPPGPAAGAAGAVSRAGFAGRPRPSGGAAAAPRALAPPALRAPRRAPPAPSLALVSRVDPALPEAPLPPPRALAPPALRAPRRAPPAPSLALVSRVDPALPEAPLPPPRALAPPAPRAPRRAPPAPSLALVSRVDPALLEAPLPPPRAPALSAPGPCGGRRRRHLSR